MPLGGASAGDTTELARACLSICEDALARNAPSFRAAHAANPDAAIVRRATGALLNSHHRHLLRPWDKVHVLWGECDGPCSVLSGQRELTPIAAASGTSRRTQGVRCDGVEHGRSLVPGSGGGRGAADRLSAGSDGGAGSDGSAYAPHKFIGSLAGCSAGGARSAARGSSGRGDARGAAACS